MTWLNIAYGFLFVSNLLFMVGSAYLLYRVLSTTAQSRADLLKAASLTMEAGKHLKLAAQRTVTELDRVREAHQHSDNASSRAIHALSFKVQNLVDNLEQSQRAGLADGLAADMTIEEQKQVGDMRAKLQAELNTALSKNHVLQGQIEEIQVHLEGASERNVAMRAELSELQGEKQAVVDGLLKQTSALETELQKAREQVLAAERQAEEAASQLDEIRARINEQTLIASQGGIPGTDQSALIEDQQTQIDLLASREKALLTKMEQMELEFQRQKTEKAFIEDRFLQLDSASPPQGALPGQAPEASSA